MSICGSECLICGEGHLENLNKKASVEYKGERGEIDFHYSVCDACGSEQADAGQTRANKRAFNAFKKEVDGLLTGEEIRALRKQLGLNQAEAAKIFGGGPVAFSKYEKDDVAQAESMDKLLRAASQVSGVLAFLTRLEQMEPPASVESRVVPVNFGEPQINDTPVGGFVEVVEEIAGLVEIAEQDLGDPDWIKMKAASRERSVVRRRVRSLNLETAPSFS